MKLPDMRTIFPILGIDGETTTLTLEKWIADLLHKKFDNVHRFIEDVFQDAQEKYPELSRRAQGDHVRYICFKEVEELVDF